MNKTIQIKTKTFVAAVVIEGGKVVRWAPILKYMKGWTEHSVFDYAKKMGWTATEIS